MTFQQNVAFEGEGINNQISLVVLANSRGAVVQIGAKSCNNLGSPLAHKLAREQSVRSQHRCLGGIVWLLLACSVFY